MDKIFPYDLGKSQDIRIMVVFGVHDFLKVGLITGFCVARSIYWQSNFKSNFKVNTNLKKFVSHLQTLLRSCFLLCFRHELLMSVAIFFFSRFLYQTLAVRTVINPGMSSSPELESVPTSCGDLTWYVKHFSKISIVKAVQWTDCIMDRILQKVEVGKFITIALKSIPKLVKLQSLVAKCCKMWKI